jgi:hypothetical protein
MEIDLSGLEGALEVLGQLLEDRGLHYEVVAVGGGSLLLLGLIDRTTRDLDLVALKKGQNLISANPLPPLLLKAVAEVGIALGLGKEWLNIGPSSLLDTGLPPGFVNRLHVRRYRGLTLYLSDRFDQICLKLYASVDQGPQSKHYQDLLLLHPTPKELLEAKKWCLTQDVSKEFEYQLNEAVKSIYA